MKFILVQSPGLCLLTVALMTSSCWSKFILQEKGIKTISLKSLAFTFYAAIQNDGSGFSDVSKIPIRLQMLLCCQRIGKPHVVDSQDLDLDVDVSSLRRDTSNWDCQSMIVHSGLAFHVHLNDTRLLIAYFLNKHLLNRQGICTFQIHNAPLIPPFSIQFSTRIKKTPTPNENLYPVLVDGNDSKKKLEVCDSLDEDPLENCRPVNCLWKYTGFRSFYNPLTKVCEPTPTCEEIHVDSNDLRIMDYKEHHPSLVLDINTNKCINQTDDTVVKSPIKSRSLVDSADGKIIVHKDSSVKDFTLAYGLTLTKLTIAVILTCTFIILTCVVLNFFFGCCFCNLVSFTRKEEKNGPSCSKSKSPFKSSNLNSNKNLFGKKSSQKYEPLRNYGDSSPEAADKVIEEIKDRREMKSKPISQPNFSHHHLHEAAEEEEGEEEEEMEHENLSAARLSTQNAYGLSESSSKKYTSPPKSQQSAIQSTTTMSTRLSQSSNQQAQSPQQKLSITNSTQGESETQVENPPSPKKTLPNVVQFLQHFQNFPYLSKAKESDEYKHRKSYFELYEAFGKSCPGKGKKIVRSLDTESSITFQKEQPREHGQKSWSPSTNNNKSEEPAKIPNPHSQRIYLGNIPKFNPVIHKIQENQNPTEKTAPPFTTEIQQKNTDMIQQQRESPVHKNVTKQQQQQQQQLQNSTRIHDQQIEIISQRLNSHNFFKDSQESSDCTIAAASNNYSSPHTLGQKNQGQQEKHCENAAQNLEQGNDRRPEVSLPSWASVSSFKGGSAPTPFQSQNQQHSQNRMFSAEMLEAMNLMKELERRSQGQGQRDAPIQNPNPNPNQHQNHQVDDISHASLHNQASVSPQLMRRIKEEPPIPMSMIYGNSRKEFHDLDHKIDPESSSPVNPRKEENNAQKPQRIEEKTVSEKPPRPPRPQNPPPAISQSQSRGSISIRSNKNRETGSDKNSPVQSVSSSRYRKSNHHDPDREQNLAEISSAVAESGQESESISESPMPMSRQSNSSLIASTVSVPSIQGRSKPQKTDSDSETGTGTDDFKSANPFMQYNLMVEEQTKYQTNAAQKILESALRLQKEINGGDQRGRPFEYEMDSTKKEESLDDFPKPSQLQLQQELEQNVLQDLSSYEFSGAELEFERRNSQNSIFSVNHTSTENKQENRDYDNQNENENDDDDDADGTDEDETETEEETENEKENGNDVTSTSCEEMESDGDFERSLNQNIFNLKQQQQNDDAGGCENLVHSPSNLTASELSCSVSTSNSSLSELIQEQLKQTDTRSNHQAPAGGGCGGNFVEDFWSNEFQRGPGPGLEYSSGSGSSSSPSDQAVQKAFWIENFVCPTANSKSGL